MAETHSLHNPQTQHSAIQLGENPNSQLLPEE